MFVSKSNTDSGNYQIDRSLRFRASASAYLSRTPTVAGSSTTWTWSGWIKRGRLTSTGDSIYSAGTNIFTIRFAAGGVAGDQIEWYQYDSNIPGFYFRYVTTQVFRDPSSWLHIVMVANTASATASERLQLYVNGLRIAAFDIAIHPTQWFTTAVGSNTLRHDLGSMQTYGVYLDGYLSEVNFIDGQALTPSSFGETDPATGQWVAKKYTGTYGTNGFYLPFNDPTNLTTLTADKSGNGNNWTANNISLTAGVTYDSMLDVPAGNAWDDGGNGRGNYATLNPLASTAVPIEGNLLAASGASIYAIPASVVLPGSGKFYAEYAIMSATSPAPQVGVLDLSANFRANAFMQTVGQGVVYSASGQTYLNGTLIATYSTYTAGDVVSIAYDAATRFVWVAKNGVWQNSGNPAAGTGYIATATAPVQGNAFACAAYNTAATSVNFGQRPFAYTPPAGFKALHTGNLPATAIPNPAAHFDVVLATGANIKSTAEAKYPYFLEWIKDRANVNNHQLIDTVRGTSAVLQSNTTAAETTYVAPAGSAVGWVWKLGGAAVANNAGTIASQVSANVVAGFSVVTYTGTGANATVGHGLGVAPKMVIVKSRGNASTSWVVWHQALAATEYLLLESAAAKAVLAAAVWNSTLPTSSVFSLGTNPSTNPATLQVAYCFAEVPGFSKFGSYTGNGSADGPFVYCGFRPRWVLVKRADGGAGYWYIFDTARNTGNLNSQRLYPNDSLAEGGPDTFGVDTLSNGFKVCTPDTSINISGGTYIFAALAESPLKYANAR